MHRERRTSLGGKAARRTRPGGAAFILLLAIVLAAGLPWSAAAAPGEAANAASCVYRAAFVADVTVPDGTVMPPGTAFMKVWRLRNSGTCAWGPGTGVTALAFTGGDPLGSPGIVPLTTVIGPGKTGDVSVTLTTPATSGTYRSEWKLRQTSGATFGVGTAGKLPLYVTFVVRTGEPAPGRIQFARGATVTCLQDAVTFPQRKSYVLRALAGQVMTVAVVSANNVANFSIQGVTDGIPYKRLENEDRSFTFTLPSTQDYLIKVATPGGSASYALSIAISPLP